MSWITLRTHDGHFLSTDPDGRLVAAGLACTAENLLACVDAGAGKVTLLPVSPGRTTRHPQHTFSLRELGGGKAAFESGDGHYLSAETGGAVVANRTSIGPWETFLLARHDDVQRALSALSCCCGLRHDHPGGAPVDAAGHVLWKARTHRWLVESAAAILLHHRPGLPEAECFGSFWENPTFQTNLFKGLLDADFVSPYRDTLWSCHFYDPDTRKNIFGNTDWTALTQCVQHFDISREKARQILPGRDTSEAAYREAGYHLGLSLHYLTDLSQPMHAANFANILPTLNPGDWRHLGFEEYFEAIMQSKDDPSSPAYAKARALMVDPATVSADELTAREFPTIEALVDTVARHTKRVFLDHLQGPADAKIHVYPTPSGPMVVIAKEWTAAEADPAIQASVPHGQRMAARFLVAWARG